MQYSILFNICLAVEYMHSARHLFLFNLAQLCIHQEHFTDHTSLKSERLCPLYHLNITQQRMCDSETTSHKINTSLESLSFDIILSASYPSTVLTLLTYRKSKLRLKYFDLRAIDTNFQNSKKYQIMTE